MISTATLLDRLSGQRCAVDALSLQSNELLVSSRVAPYLYGPVPAPEGVEKVVNMVIDATLDAMPTVASQGMVEARESIRRFWARVLAKSHLTKKAREDVVHAYMFYFWELLREEAGFPLPMLQDAFIPQSKRTWSIDSVFCEKLAPRFLQYAPADVVARDGVSLYVVEVKFGEMDDRAIGQLLRYFEASRWIVTNVDHLCDLRRVVPVVIVKMFPHESWVALPAALRELLEVYFFDVSSDDRLLLRDGRQQLRNALKGHRRYAF